MVIDIYIKERNGSREIRIPWLPEEIEYKSGGTTFATYDIMNKGEVKVPTGSGLRGWNWEGIFPGANRTDKAMLRGEWKAPETYHNILEDWKAKGTALTILVTGYPINHDVYLEDYNGKATGGFGDWEYDISFVEDRDLSAAVKPDGKENTPKRSTTETTTYTIKQGDTLWSIAQQYAGGGANWNTIYNKNKEIIERTAEKRWKAAGKDRDSQNGHWIFPGTVITISK